MHNNTINKCNHSADSRLSPYFAKRLRRTDFNKFGFTIVELIVVISIIGILASIVIVSYGSWKQSTTTAQLKSDLNGVASAMENARTFGNTYSTTIPSTFVPSSGVTLGGGGLNSGKGYCVDATNGTQSYHISSLYTTPLAGICPVLNLDAGISASYPGTGITWTDLSGNGNNGTLSATGVSYSSENGGALSFDGANGYVSVPNIALDNRNATAEVWLKHPGTLVANQSYGAIMIGTQTGIMTGAIGGSLIANTWNTTYTLARLVSTPNINDSHYHQVAMTLDSNYINLYCDGNYIGHADTVTGFVMPNIGTSIQLGRRSSAYPWNGSIAAARIYNRTLTATEIKNNFENLHSRFGL